MLNTLFSKMGKKKTTTDVSFKNTVCPVPWKLRTQEKECSIDSWNEVEAGILGVFSDPDEFVVLTTGDARWQIRYVQATQTKEGIDVELGIEEGDKTRLVGKNCSQRECMDIFREFYQTSNVQERDTFQPVDFFA